MNTDTINSLLISYAGDTENPELNWQLALQYHLLGQTASAISFYLRAAERTDDKALSYECLLRIAACFDSQGNRASHVVGLYKHAICLLPERPEAYFLLSRFNERNKWFMESYVTAEQGLNFAKFDLPKLRTYVEYPGKYGLIFEKAVSAWWWGKSAESRKLFKKLAVDHKEDLLRDPIHYHSVKNNLMRLGSGPESQATRIYYKNNHNALRFKFKGSENIERSYAQVYQDMFVLSMLNGKRNGSYLEIGSSDPFNGNNTALLEQLFGWVGVGIEIDQNCVLNYSVKRTNKVLHKNALEVDYSKLLKEIATDGVVDYLQLDCEPAETTFEIMLKIPFDEYKFAVITYEHDHHVDFYQEYREKSRKFLTERGYLLVVNDVSTDGISTFEDWWVHPDLVDLHILDVMRDVNLDSITRIEDYFLCGDRIPKKYEGFPDIYYISLKESEDRRKNLVQQLMNCNVFNYLTVKPFLVDRFKDCNYELEGELLHTLAEHSKGPVTSHILILKKWLEETNDQETIIGEDDLCFDVSKFWSFTWKEFYDKLPEDWECVQLTWIRPKMQDIKFRERDGWDWNASAYLVKRSYAEKVVSHYYKDGKFILNCPQSNLMPIIENVIFSGLGRVYNIPLFVEDNSRGVVSTYMGALDENAVVNGQGPHHWESYSHIYNWWKDNGLSTKIDQIM